MGHGHGTQPPVGHGYATQPPVGRGRGTQPPVGHSLPWDTSLPRGTAMGHAGSLTTCTRSVALQAFSTQQPWHLHTTNLSADGSGILLAYARLMVARSLPHSCSLSCWRPRACQGVAAPGDPCFLSGTACNYPPLRTPAYSRGQPGPCNPSVQTRPHKISLWLLFYKRLHLRVRQSRGKV